MISVIYIITDGDDYFRQDLVLTFETTSTSMDVVIPLINDDVMEGEETFTLCLVLLDGAEGVRLGSPSTTTVNITDDDGMFQPTRNVNFIVQAIACIHIYYVLLV